MHNDVQLLAVECSGKSEVMQMLVASQLIQNVATDTESRPYIRSQVSIRSPIREGHVHRNAVSNRVDLDHAPLTDDPRRCRMWGGRGVRLFVL